MKQIAAMGAGAAAAVLLANYQLPIAVVGIGSAGPLVSLPGSNEQAVCGSELEGRVARTEERIRSFEHKLHQAQLQLRATRRALMVARLDMLTDDAGASEELVLGRD